MVTRRRPFSPSCRVLVVPLVYSLDWVVSVLKGISSSRVSTLVMRTSSRASCLVTISWSPSWILESSARSTLEIRIQGTQLPEGQVVLLGNGPQGIARLDRVNLLLLLHAGQHILNGIVILKAVVEIDSIFQRHIFAKAHADILVCLILVGASRLSR